MDARTHILLLDTNDAMGGVVRVHLNLLRALDRGRFEATAACLGRGEVLPFFRQLEGTRLLGIEAGTKGRRARGRLRALPADLLGLAPMAWSVLRMARAARRSGIQVLYTSDKKRAVLMTLWLHRLTGLPFVYHIHNIYVDYPANRRALRRAAAVVANSGAMKADFVEALGEDMRRIRVIYNGLDPREIRPDRPSGLRAELGADEHDVLIGIASRLAPDKGQDVFLRAAQRVAAADPRARFAVAGDDAIYSDNDGYVRRLRKMVEDKGLTDRVHFLGCREDMPAVYAGLDVVVNAAAREAFGMVVIEPMACAKPVVGSDAGGIPEIISHGRDGLLFPAGDDAALADALLELLGDAQRRRAMGRAARETVLEKFTIAAQTHAMEDVFRTVAEVAR